MCSRKEELKMFVSSSNFYHYCTALEAVRRMGLSSTVLKTESI